MALKPTLVSLLIFIVLATGIFKAYSMFHRVPFHKLSPDLQWIGMIDITNAHDLSLNGVLNSENWVLVVDHSKLLYHEITQKIPQAKYLSAAEVFNLYNLHLLDANNDSIIDAHDPIYKHLYIIEFKDKGEQYQIKSLSETGIRGIYVHRLAPSGEHIVTMADGSERILYNASKLEQ